MASPPPPARLHAAGRTHARARAGAGTSTATGGGGGGGGDGSFPLQGPYKFGEKHLAGLLVGLGQLPFALREPEHLLPVERSQNAPEHRMPLHVTAMAWDLTVAQCSADR